MIENTCAEVLLTGLLWVNNKSVDFDLYNKVYHTRANQSAYVLADDVALMENECKNEKLSKKISHADMKGYLVKLN